MGNRKLKQQTKKEWTRQEGRQLFGEGPVADPVRKAAALQLSLIHISEPTRPY